jgi:hypothetical protein
MVMLVSSSPKMRIQSFNGQPRLCGASWMPVRESGAQYHWKNGTYRAFACEQNALRAAAAHAHKAIKAERVDVRLQAEFCSVEVVLKKRRGRRRAEALGGVGGGVGGALTLTYAHNGSEGGRGQ